ncbi:hypothetical protein IB238_23880 [Rhizobium sp. ARZ01]|nr:hypothetical protein [Rhizobium sp. ARZ01]
MTLDYVIVFAHEADALHNVVGWVHELTHVRQYQDWECRASPSDTFAAMAQSNRRPTTKKHGIERGPVANSQQTS